MNFSGRWVPMQVMDTILLLWLIAVLVIAALLLWFMRVRPRLASNPNGPDKAARKKRSGRKKR